MEEDPITVFSPSTDAHVLPSIVALHADCIMQDGTLATFLPPLDHAAMLSWWQDRAAEVADGRRHIIFMTRRQQQTNPASTSTGTRPTTTAAAATVPTDVIGMVSLVTPFSETGPMRGLVEKLFTSPSCRQQGVARRLMAALERVAVDCGRWSLILDTTVGTPAEHVYPRLGWERVGVVPAHGIHPLSGKLVDEVWFSKDLRGMMTRKEGSQMERE